MHHDASLSGRIAALLLVLAAPAAAQSAFDPSVAPASHDLLRDLGLSEATVQRLEIPAEPGATFSFPLWVEGAWREVTAWPYSLRASGYRLMVEDGTGAAELHPPTAETTYRGEVAGLPGSRVALNLFGGQVQGLLRLGEGREWHGFQPVSALATAADPALHVVYSELSVLPVDATCGGALDALRGAQAGGGAELSAAEGGGSICEIALDADFEYFQSNGSSVVATENDITGVINAVGVIYDATAEIVYEITVIYVQTAEPDPYSSTSSGTLLDQFQDHWNSQHDPDPRDVAHLFTGKNLSGSTIGIAFLNTICNLGSAYGVSQSKFSSSFSFRVGLTAHELGHSWSANHCDGQPSCGIMCSGIGGCSGSVTTFGPSEAADILGKKASSGCLESLPPPSAPVLTSLVPSTVQAFQGGPLTLNGFFFEDVESLHFGGTTLTAPFGFVIVSDTKITLNAPTATALGTVAVTAENEAGPSNPLNLTYVETNPPKLTSSGFGITGALFNWTFGAQANDAWFLGISLNDPSTVPLFGFNVLASGFLFTSGTLSSVGLGALSIVVPPGAGGATVYSQLLTLDGGTFAFSGASNVTTSTILF
jgi:hypothetical protein